ncbi:MAG: hypothetical protein KF718_29065 [Polyangiaceae bacterium]|nr:hypothetical protein [Polyangiaceae bacterium]
MDHAAHARALFERNHFVATIDHALLAAKELGPSPAALEMRVLVGRALEQLRQHPPALHCLEQILAEAPDHAHALAHRGGVSDRMLQREPAKADLRRALELDPDYPYAWENLFYVSFDTQDPETCDRALSNLERLGAEKGYLYRLRGKRRLDAGDRDGAESDLRKACLHVKGDPVAAEILVQAGFPLVSGDEHFMFGTTLEQSNPALGVEHCSKALELGLSSPRRDLRTVDYLGRMLGALGRKDEAVAAARALTERHPDRADTWLTRAAIDGETASFAKAHELSAKEAAVLYARHLFAQGDKPKALEICSKHATDDPMDASAQVLLGELYRSLEQMDDAKAAWLRAEALGDAQARKLRTQTFGNERGLDHFDAALDLLDQRMQADAVAEFETAAEAFRKEARVPGDAPSRYLSKALYNSAFLRELEVPDSVIEPNLREAIALDPAYPDALCALGNLCIRTDRLQEGLEYLARAGAADPSAGQPWFYRARHFAENAEHENVLPDATRAFEAYRNRGQGRFAADAAMMRGEANEALGRLQDAKRDYDLAYDFGHPIGYARGDHIRTRIAAEDPSSVDASEILDNVIERIEANECPSAHIDFLKARTQSSDKASALVAKLEADEELEPDEVDWLVEFLESS